MKRLLAFSTVSHMGVVLGAVALFDADAFGGAALYAAAHGLIKGGLFLCAGMLLHRYRTIDERALFGRVARGIAALLVLGALGLASFAPAGTFVGEHAASEAAGSLRAPFVRTARIASVLTAAAVLRPAARIAFGWGPEPERDPAVEGEQSEAPETKGPSTTPWTMIAPAFVLLVGGFAIGVVPGARAAATHAGARILDARGYVAAVFAGTPARFTAARDGFDVMRSVFESWIVTGAAFALAGAMRVHRGTFGRLRVRVAPILAALARPIRAAHSGLVNDYVAWLTAGAALLSGLCASLLR